MSTFGPAVRVLLQWPEYFRMSATSVRTAVTAAFLSFPPRPKLPRPKFPAAVCARVLPDGATCRLPAALVCYSALTVATIGS